MLRRVIVSNSNSKTFIGADNFSIANLELNRSNASLVALDEKHAHLSTKLDFFFEVCKGLFGVFSRGVRAYFVFFDYYKTLLCVFLGL